MCEIEPKNIIFIIILVFKNKTFLILYSICDTLDTLYWYEILNKTIAYT